MADFLLSPRSIGLSTKLDKHGQVLALLFGPLVVPLHNLTYCPTGLVGVHVFILSLILALLLKSLLTVFPNIRLKNTSFCVFLFCV